MHRTPLSYSVPIRFATGNDTSQLQRLFAMNDPSQIRTQVEAILDELASERDPRQQADVADFIIRATEALKLARRIGWREGVGLALLQLARRQEPREAEETLRRALALFRRLRHRSGEISTLNNLALIYWHDGQNTLAMHFLTMAYGLLREFGDIPAYDHAMMLLNLTAVSFEHSVTHAALIIAEESIDFCRRHDLDDVLVRAYGVTGRALWRQSFDRLAFEYAAKALAGRDPDAATLLERAETGAAYPGVTQVGVHAVALFDELHNDHERAVVLLALGIASLRLGDNAAAQRYLEEALPPEASSGYLRACVLNTLADLYINSGQVAAGMMYAKEALAIAEGWDDRLLQGLAYGVLYRGAKALGNQTAALEYLEHSLVLAQEVVAGGDMRFGDLPIQKGLEDEWRRRAIHRMALLTGGAGRRGIDSK